MLPFFVSLREFYLVNGGKLIESEEALAEGLAYFGVVPLEPLYFSCPQVGGSTHYFPEKNRRRKKQKSAEKIGGIIDLVASLLLVDGE